MQHYCNSQSLSLGINTNVNQSDCEKVIDNVCSFFVSPSWSCSEINILFEVEYYGKEQMECGSVLSVLLSIMVIYSL